MQKTILQCWEGHHLKEEDKKLFRHYARYKEGQIMFVYLLNRYRTNKCFELGTQMALHSVSELVKIILDEI